jgi:hypothetical protein
MRWKAKTLGCMDKKLLVKHEDQINPQNLGQRIKMYHEKVITCEQGYYEARENWLFVMCFFLNICAKGGSTNLSCVPHGHKVMFPSEFRNKT